MSFSSLYNDVLHHRAAESLGWVLVHFVWQGVAVALLLSLILMSLRKSSPNARYVAACAGLLVMATLPAITYFALPSRTTFEPIPFSRFVEKREPDELETMRNAKSSMEIVGAATNKPGDEAAGLEEVKTLGDRVAVPTPQPVTRAESFASRCDRLVRPWLPSITLLWSIGVLVLSVRLLVTWRHVQSIQTFGVRPADAARISLLQQIATKLGVHQVVRLLESSLVEVPTVIGWLKPVILLPIASISSLTPAQLEAILAHELAHIRRADYAINVLQSLIETLLFYHPAVWWISSRIRQERENCCDDLAASISGDAAGYIAALVRMEELRSAPRELTLAARGGDLLSRVRRLLRPAAHDRVSSWWLSGAVGILIAAGVIGLPILTKTQAVSVAADDQKKSTEVIDADARGKQPDDKTLEDDALDQITPAEIADRIEEAWKRYGAVEYSATLELTRNTNWHQPDAKPILVNGTGEIRYVSDGHRWFVDEKSFSTVLGSSDTSPTETISAFNGTIHSAFDGSKFVIGEEELAHDRLKPNVLFWESGLSAEWLLAALRRPEAKMTERIKLAETSCLHVEVKWNPKWDNVNRTFDIMICPEQGWLPRRVSIERGGEMTAEWFIRDVGTTESGLFYPVVINVQHPDTAIVATRTVRITNFRDRTDFAAAEFAIPIPDGVDVVDHRRGLAWHKNPWWDEMTPWIVENLNWPLPNLNPLRDLHSDRGSEMSGAMAPPLNVGEWLTESVDRNWNRPDRKLTVLHFFGGRLIGPTPKTLKALDYLHQLYRDGGLEVIAVATFVDRSELTRQAVKELDLSFPVAIDSKASEADVKANPDGSQWGSTFAAFRQKSYSGTVLIDHDGKVVQLEPNTNAPLEGFSPLESLVREQLQRANGSSDPPSLRQMIVNRMSKILRGRAADLAELRSAINDPTPLWRENAEQQIAATVPAEQKELFKSHGMTVTAALYELKQNQRRIPRAVLMRIEEEWKRRVSETSGHGVIRGTVQRADGSKLTGGPATLALDPAFFVLNSSTLGSRHVMYDRSRQLTIDTDTDGKFRIEKLPKGTFQLTVKSPGSARTMRTIQLSGNDSIADLDIVLSQGDSISGKVMDAEGNAIPSAKVKAIQRYYSAANPRSYTTEFLLNQPATTGKNGEFVFESLYEGDYVFEVGADDYESATTEKIPAGKTDVKIVLKPIETAALEERQIPTSIAGTVVDKSTNQPIPNAQVGLQFWHVNGQMLVGPLKATAVTGNDGRYVLDVPPGTEPNMTSFAVWAKKDGFQPSCLRLGQALWFPVKDPVVELTPSTGFTVRLRDDRGQPVANAAVTVPRQTLPKMRHVAIPDEWQDFVTEKTDANGFVTLSNVIPEAVYGLRISQPNHDTEIRLDSDFWLNNRPGKVAPHFHFTLPKTGMIEGQLNVSNGSLPANLTLEISTEFRIPHEPAAGISIARKVPVDQDGRFKVQSLAAGKVFIKPFLSVDQPLRAEVPSNIRVVAGESKKIEIPIQKGVHLRGRIIQSDTRKGHPGVKFFVLYGTSARDLGDMDNKIEVATDQEGRFDAWVPPGPIILRISWDDENYSDVEQWSERRKHLGSEFMIPLTDEFDLEPIEFVPTKAVAGKLIDADGKPLAGYTVYGYPSNVVVNALGLLIGQAVTLEPDSSNCVSGTQTDDEGKFEGRYPSTHPPAFWRVMNNIWETPLKSVQKEWKAKIVSKQPLILKVDTKSKPRSSL